MRSKSSALTYPVVRAASRKVVPSSLALWAMAELAAGVADAAAGS
jgi:hypothetical protein